MPLGMVYLVGAGPGSPDLLTRRAAALLGAADVVLHDRLIQPEVLALARAGAERIFVGKATGDHLTTQDDINDTLVRQARAGRLVVRLKGGDPFLFGRGGEEAKYLAAHGVPFEVVPGVSSLLAAPLRAGIPVTFRGVASSVAFVTGHESDPSADALDWQALSRIPTLVVAMPLQNVRAIAARLIAHGRPGSTPAAMIESAYWEGERVVEATLESIGDAVESAGMKSPATLVVGDVVRVRSEIAALRAGEAEMAGETR